MAITRIRLRRGSAADWVTANPVLAAGEPGVELDTGKQKIGDGVKTWTQLDYTATTGEPGPPGPATTNASLLTTGTVPEGRLPSRLSDSQLTATYAPALPTTAVARDTAGKVSSVTDNGMTETYTRDSFGRVATITRNSVTKTVSRDTTGRVTGVA